MQILSENPVRRRGVILSPKGLKKLNQAKSEVEIERKFRRYTLEAISEKTGLTPTTLSKIFVGSVGVDKRTLECCLRAFNLTLEKEDYRYLECQMGEMSETYQVSSAQNSDSISSAGDSPLKELPSSSQTPQTRKMDRPQDEIKTRPPTPLGGQMPLDSVYYIDRPIRESLCYETIQQLGAFLNIRALKQMGKTSLMTRMLAYAKSQGYHTVSLSLQLADAEILQNLERFLKWFCARVNKQLGLPNQIADFWDNSLGSKANATDYFNDVILANCDRPLVIAIDELNQLFAHPDIAREFLLLLRTWSEQAKAGVIDSNPWYKLRLVTVHSTQILMPPAIDPSLLNTGLVIELLEFTQAQVQDLAYRWEQEISKQQIEQLITLLGGHPYRLQLAFSSLQQQTITLTELLANSEIAFAIYADHLEQQWWNLQCYPNLLPSFT